MSKINIHRPDLYMFDRPDLQERTENRLRQISDAGMEEVGVAEFGVPSIMSGLYIEKVWNYSDKDWNEYMRWATDLIKEKAH